MYYVYYNGSIGNKIQLPEVESKHCVQVLRMREGSALKILDGKGTIADARILKADRRICEVEILNKTEVKSDRDYKLTIAIAPTKNIDRFEWFVEKATELGVDKILPIITSNSERKNLRLDRIEKIIISATKQSIRAYKPELLRLMTFAEAIDFNTELEEKYIAHCYDYTNKKNLFKTASCRNDTVLFIGPEGDFTEDEISIAINNNFVATTLGEQRLRTETAGIAACSTFLIKDQFLKYS